MSTMAPVIVLSARDAAPTPRHCRAIVDIHPPHGPVNSFKDFLLHLLTVILGILIALRWRF